MTSDPRDKTARDTHDGPRDPGVDVSAVDLPDGTPAAVVAAAISERRHPPHVREGLTLRRLVMAGQPCACGARVVMPNRAERRAARRTGQVLHARVAHDTDCLAVAPDVVAAARAAFDGGHT